MDELKAWVDCRGRNAHEVIASVLPHCLDAASMGLQPVIVVDNLDQLVDSVSRLLKALDRMAAQLHARVVLADRSGFATAFREAMSVSGHLESPA